MVGVSSVLRFLVAVGVPVAAAGYAANRLIRPPLAGNDNAIGIDGTIEILRDRSGIPHIRATSFRDLFFAQGYVQAQDRAWQLDLMRRVATGRLSEVLGSNLLATDRLFRTIGFERAAHTEWLAVSGESRTMLEAFAHGVNAALSSLPAPFEARLLRYKIKAWTPADSLAVLRLMGWGLSGNWESELARLRLAQQADHAAVYRSEPGYPAGNPLSSPSGSLSEGRPVPLEPDFIPFLGGGSNGWAVSAGRSATGAPLLAGDPHLRFNLPGPFHLCHLEGAGIHSAGAAVVGLPTIIIGHSEQVAWTVTAALPDTQDLFVETPNPVNPNQFEHNGWEDATIIEEIILVKGAAHHVETIVQTAHGPLLNNVVVGLTAPTALRSTLLDSFPRHAESALALNRATSVEEARDALRHWSIPALNFILADRAGAIGYQMAGSVPARPTRGVVPVDGRGAFDWQGWVPFEELPADHAPSNGWVLNANNRPSDASHAIGFEWIDGFRAARLAQLIEQTPKHSKNTFREMQGDQLSIPLTKLSEALSGLRPGTAAEARALDLLAGWDGRVKAESAAAAVAEATRRALLYAAARESFGPLAEIRLGVGPHPAANGNSYGLRNSAYLLDLIESWQRDGSWPDRARAALGQAVADLNAAFPSPAAWTWSGLRGFELRHPLGQVKALAKMLNRGPFPIGGDNDTPFQVALSSGLSFAAESAIPALRFIADLGNWDASTVVMPGGNSGNPFSKHYNDMTADWLAMRSVSLHFTREAVDQAAVARRVITPA